MFDTRDPSSNRTTLEKYPSRSVGVDIVRLLGICGILLGHVSVSPLVIKATYPWHVPVFFFLAGVVYVSGRPMRLEWRKRYNSLGRPYLAWLLLISLVAIPRVLLHGDAAEVLRRISTIILGGSELKTPFTAFWFFSCLFAAAVFWRLLDNLGVPWWAVGIVALLLTPIGSTLAPVPLSIGTAIPSMVFIAAGRAYRLAPRSLKSWPLGLVALSLGSLAVVSGISPPLDLKSGNFGVPVIGIVVAILISAGLLSCAIEITPVLGRIGLALGPPISKYGSSVILAHGLPLAFLYGRFSTPLVLTGVVLATVVLVTAAARSPWRSALLGLSPSAQFEVPAPGSTR